MNVATAGGTWRRPTRRDLCILALAAIAHALVLLALATGAHWTPQLVEPPVMQAELLDAPSPPAKARAPIAAVPANRATNSVAPSPPVAILPPPATASKGPPAIVAPPGFTARKLVDESDATRESLRGSLGCRHEKTAALTKAEKAACAEADGLRARTAPMYAAIDPDKKAAFDGDCAKDDDWCLYRTGKGPYPGIFALGRKKKRKGWDD